MEATKLPPQPTYLVILRCVNNDFPLFVTHDHAAAKTFAEQHDGKLPAHVKGLLYGSKFKSPKVMDVSIIKFDANGTPVGFELAQDLDELD